jgi:hypothetical protein
LDATSWKIECRVIPEKGIQKLRLISKELAERRALAVIGIVSDIGA